MSERRLFAHELAARLDELLLLSLRQQSPDAVAQALEAMSRHAQERALHWIGVAAQLSSLLGQSLAEGVADHADDLDDWARAGLDAYDVAGIDAAVRVWRQAATRGGRHATFAEMEARLQRFVQALDGRSLTLAAGDAAWTDTATLWLPSTLDVLPDAEGNRRLYLLTASLLWAQTRYGSFDEDPEAALCQWPDRNAALAWLEAFEAMRLEARLAVDLPGMARDMAALRGAWPVALADAAADLARPDATVADSLRWLEWQRQLDAQTLAPGLPYLGRFDPLAARRVRAAHIPRDSTPLRQTPNVLRGAGGRGQDRPELSPAAAEAAMSGFDPAAELLDLPADSQASTRSQQHNPGQIPPEVAHPAGPGVWQPVADSADEGDSTEKSGEPDARYDEWDYRRQAFRRGWCQLYEAEAPAGDPAWVEETRRRHAHLIRSLRRRFEALRGEDKIHRRQLDGDDIDLDAQVESHADRKSGAEPSPRLFRQRRRDERSLAVMFMVDMSGSTKGWVNDAERESLVLLGEAIESLDDRYAIYGFSGWTRTRCDIYRIKRFDQAYDDAVRRRIAGIEARDYTRMGVAVRHLTALLAREPARHKLLVTLSDGRPDDHGDEYRGRYGIEDTRRALHEAREQGIRSYCVTIDRHGADYLPQLYGPAHYTVIDDAKKLPMRLAEIYRKLIV